MPSHTTSMHQQKLIYHTDQFHYHYSYYLYNTAYVNVMMNIIIDWTISKLIMYKTYQAVLFQPMRYYQVFLSIKFKSKLLINFAWRHTMPEYELHTCGSNDMTLIPVSKYSSLLVVLPICFAHSDLGTVLDEEFLWFFWVGLHIPEYWEELATYQLAEHSTSHYTLMLTYRLTDRRFYIFSNSWL